MVLTKNYDIHNILTLQVKTNNKSLLKGLNFPLTYFQVDDEISNPDIILNIGKFSPSNKDCYLVDHKYHIKKNYLYCKDSQGKAKWEVEINGFEHPPTVINYNGKIRRMYRILAPDVLPQDSILYPIIEFSLGQKGFFLTHGAGVVKEGKAVAFLGRGGTLKTTLIMNAVKQNHKILGDDRIIFNTNGDHMAYVFPHFYQNLDYTIENFNNEQINIHRKVLLFKNLLKETPPTSQIWQSEPVNLRSIFLLKRIGTGNGKMRIHPISKDRAIQKMIANNKSEIYVSSITSIVSKRNFMEYMLAYSFVFPNSEITKYWEKLKNGLHKMLRDIPIYEIELPQKYSKNIYEDIQSLTKEIE